MPKPGKNETQDDFIKRCIPIVLDDGTAKDQDQAVAICHSMWENKSMAMPTRAYATFTVKSIDEKKRIIEGIASTPNTDRTGDIVEPMGAKYSLPMPFLWQHRSDQPIGQVISAKTTSDGISFTAKLAVAATPGKLKDRLEEAWQSIDLGLVRGISIGFVPTDMEPIDHKDPWGGQHIKEWNWFELSAVTIPANADASVTNIRSIVEGKAPSSKQTQAASGQADKPAAVAVPSIKIKGAKMAKTTNAERMKDLEAKRAATVAAREEIQNKVMEEDRTKDEKEQQEFDEHSVTIKNLDRELADCRLLEKEMVAQARPVVPSPSGDGVELGNPTSIQVKMPTLPPGIGLVKRIACQLYAYKNSRDVISVARQFCGQWPQIEMDLKAAVAAGTTTGTTWASPLVYIQNLASEFLEFLVPQTFFGRIPNLTRVPFNSRIPRENSVITAQWVGEGRAKPVQAGSFDAITLTFAKTACIMGVTDELTKFSSPSVELLVRNNLAKGISKFVDTQFITPSITAVAGVSPASILNGADNDSASGTDITAVIHDIREILFHFQEYNIPTDSIVLIMQPVLATSIGTMMTTLGVRQFPDINGQGGSILGVPVITSNNVPSGLIAALHPPSLFVADDGGLQIDVSREASVELADNPTSTDYHIVSAFQQNLLFVRAEQYITWARGRDKGAYYLTGAAYGGAVTG